MAETDYIVIRGRGSKSHGVWFDRRNLSKPTPEEFLPEGAVRIEYVPTPFTETREDGAVAQVYMRRTHTQEISGGITMNMIEPALTAEEWASGEAAGGYSLMAELVIRDALREAVMELSSRLPFSPVELAQVARVVDGEMERDGVSPARRDRDVPACIEAAAEYQAIHNRSGVTAELALHVYRTARVGS